MWWFWCVFAQPHALADGLLLAVRETQLCSLIGALLGCFEQFAELCGIPPLNSLEVVGALLNMRQTTCCDDHA
jgi:hypothetical protein